MTIYQFNTNGLNSNNMKIAFPITLDEQNFLFKCYWNTYADCAFLDIEDMNNNKIISGRALVNGLKIRNHNIPYILNFVQVTGETYEPTLDIIEKEFAFQYEVEE